MGVNPQKIDVIYHGTSMMPQQAHPSISLPEKYVLFVGSRYKYKNFVRFVQSFAQIARKNPKLYLICTGAPFDTSELQLIESLNLSQRALSFYANDAELATLYHQAQAFIFPSLYEGFGIPILEAYACQCPVILSNASCFPEIAGDAAAFFDPTDEKEMTSSIEEVLNNPILRNELIEKGQKRLQLYSWDKTARQTEICYQKALSEGI